MDIVLKLRELRRLRGLTQRDAARMSGVGEKTISSFETGERIDALKISQLRRLLATYGMTEAEFFGGTVEERVAPWELEHAEEVSALLAGMEDLSEGARQTLLGKFHLMIETASSLHPHDRQPAGVPTEPPSEWQMLVSRN